MVPMPRPLVQPVDLVHAAKRPFQPHRAQRQHHDERHQRPGPQPGEQQDLVLRHHQTFMAGSCHGTVIAHNNTASASVLCEPSSSSTLYLFFYETSHDSPGDEWRQPNINSCKDGAAPRPSRCQDSPTPTPARPALCATRNRREATPGALFTAVALAAACAAAASPPWRKTLPRQ